MAIISIDMTIDEIRNVLNTFEPTGPWKKTFIILPTIIAGKAVMFRFVYKRIYENMYGNRSIRYKETLFDIIKS